MIYNTDKMQGFRVELQVSGRGGEVTGKGQDFDKTGTRQEQGSDKRGKRQGQDRDKTGTSQ